MLLSHIYSNENYLIGVLFLYFGITYTMAYEGLWNSKEKQEPRQTLIDLGNIILWPIWFVRYLFKYAKKIFKDFLE